LSTANASKGAVFVVELQNLSRALQSEVLMGLDIRFPQSYEISIELYDKNEKETETGIGESNSILIVTSRNHEFRIKKYFRHRLKCLKILRFFRNGLGKGLHLVQE
jgi:hypothetical protein